MPENQYGTPSVIDISNNLVIYGFTTPTPHRMQPCFAFSNDLQDQSPQEKKSYPVVNTMQLPNSLSGFPCRLTPKLRVFPSLNPLSPLSVVVIVSSISVTSSLESFGAPSVITSTAESKTERAILHSRTRFVHFTANSGRKAG